MKVRKPMSKRTPVRLRHKIEKASAGKQRKQRKLAKKDPTWRSRLKKDPGIPNLFPLKDKILLDIEQKRRQKAELDGRLREETRNAAGTGGEEQGSSSDGDGEIGLDTIALAQDESNSVEDDVMADENDTANPMTALLASARARAAEYERNRRPESADEMSEDSDLEWQGLEADAVDEFATTTSIRRDPSRKAFQKMYQQVVEASDVVLYVLDARDPESTRSKDVERMITASEGGRKRLLLVLNKIDLVPPGVLRDWLTYLRRYFPTIPLAAAKSAPNAKSFDHNITIKSTSESLLRALKTFSLSHGMRKAISVGVVGFPNVGKSSVINALKSLHGGTKLACPVGAEAGVTTGVREVKLDSKLKLLDSPGIVFPSAGRETINRQIDKARLILLNAVPPKEIDDPLPAVSLLLKRLSTSETLFSRLLELYNVAPLLSADGDATTDFLVQVARRRGRLGKGGIPNLHSAAHTVLADWREGRLQGWVEAPVTRSDFATDSGMKVSRADDDDDSEDQKIVVGQWAAEFKLDGLWGEGQVSAVQS